MVAMFLMFLRVVSFAAQKTPQELTAVSPFTDDRWKKGWHASPRLGDARRDSSQLCKKPVAAILTVSWGVQ